MPGVVAIGLLEDEAGDIFGRSSTLDVEPSQPLLDFWLLVIDLKSIEPVFTSFSALTIVIVSWISLMKNVKLIKY